MPGEAHLDDPVDYPKRGNKDRAACEGGDEAGVGAVRVVFVKDQVGDEGSGSEDDGKDEEVDVDPDVCPDLVQKEGWFDKCQEVGTPVSRSVTPQAWVAKDVGNAFVKWIAGRLDMVWRLDTVW